MLDPINPNYYKFDDNGQLVDISAWMTSGTSQAAQYIVRSTRLDGVWKDNHARIQDINKALWFIEKEIEIMKIASIKYPENDEEKQNNNCLNGIKPTDFIDYSFMKEYFSPEIYRVVENLILAGTKNWEGYTKRDFNNLVEKLTESYNIVLEYRKVLQKDLL